MPLHTRKCVRCQDQEVCISIPLQPTTGKHHGEWSFVMFYMSEGVGLYVRVRGGGYVL
jgi:hypothetical protein